MYNTEFMKLYEELSTLNEAKADIQRLVDFAGQDLAGRYEAIKKRLKAPENDLYYWIKNKTVDELEQLVTSLETSSATKKTSKALADSGAELVCNTTHWKVYHITSLEASRKYGRDAKWCISGMGEDGEHAWELRRSLDADIYFFIAKIDYDARGTDSKFALVIYSNETYDVFNQQDTNVEVLDQIPYIDEVEISGLDFDMLKPAFGDDGIGVCDSCGEEALIDDLYFLDDGSGDRYCSDCYDDWEHSGMDEEDEEDDDDDEEILVSKPASTTTHNSAPNPNDDYANYSEDSLVKYSIRWFNYRDRFENSNIPFNQAIAEILKHISELIAEAKYGIVISCSFTSTSQFGNEAFYIYRGISHTDKIEIRFNARSVSPTPDFVKNAANEIAKALGSTDIRIDDSRRF
jgi:hypothetical protein